MANSITRRESFHQALPGAGLTAKDMPATAFSQSQATYDDYRMNQHQTTHAGEVLASFNQYPIRNTLYTGYSNGPSHGNQAPRSIHQQQHQLLSDPLVQDIQAHSRDLVATLVPILHTQEGDPGTKFDINNCKGVNHIAGAMMPADEDNRSVASSPTSRSSLSSTNHHNTYTSMEQPSQQTRQSQHSQVSALSEPEPPSQSPIKTENSGFQTTFQFVVNENAKEARNTVRKHVMKEFRRRERWEQGQKGVVHGGIEKKAPASKKRRRKQESPEPDEKTPVEPQGSSQFDANSPVSTRRIVEIQPAEISSPAVNTGRNGWPDVPNPGTNPVSASNTAVRAPNKKKNKILQSPVFPESRQHQLWGAVNTDYNNAIEELEERAKGPYQSDPWAAVSVSQVDPFSKLNLNLGPATQSLLHHFAWVMPSLMDSIVTGKTFHRIGWLYSAVAIHDPTPVHVILGYTLGHIASLRGLEEPPQALEHKSKAIKLLHHRMTDPKQSYSDDLIGAIVNFAGWELICANPKAYAMHMSGLSRIVTARGGMSAFASKPELETVLVRLDAIRAYVTQSSPRYPAYSFVRALEPVAINIPYQPTKSTWTATTGTQPAYAPCEYRYCEDALSLMNKLEDVLLLCRSAASDLSGPVGEPFHKLLIKSMEQLLAKPAYLEEENGTSPMDDLYVGYAAPRQTASVMPEPDRIRLAASALAIRLAALTMLDVAIREFFDSPPYAGYYTSQLAQRFFGGKVMINDTSLGRSLDMLIAVLIQADRMALERPWRAWYAADALTLTMRITQQKWEAIGNELKEWVLAGGLESFQPQIVEEKTEVEDTKSDSFTSNKNSVHDEDNEPRSKDIWDLRDVAARFLREWEEQPYVAPTSAPQLPTMQPIPVSKIEQPSLPLPPTAFPVSSMSQPPLSTSLPAQMPTPTIHAHIPSPPLSNTPVHAYPQQAIHPHINPPVRSESMDSARHHGYTAHPAVSMSMPMPVPAPTTMSKPAMKSFPQFGNGVHIAPAEEW